MRHVAAAGLLLLLAPASCEKVTAYEPPAEKRQADLEHDALVQAKELAGKGDLEGAHARLSTVMADSPLRKQADFTRIESDWARVHIEKAKSEKNLKTRLDMLEEVSRNDAVSADVRAQAAQEATAANPQPKIRTDDPAREESERVLAEAQKALLAKQDKEAIKLVLDRVVAGKALQPEIDWLLGACYHKKDVPCIDELKKRNLFPEGLDLDAGIPKLPPKGKPSK